MKKLLLHTCCGPCFLGVWEDLATKDLEVTNYFYNPNIWPAEEYNNRRDGLENVAKKIGTQLILGDYKPSEYQKAVKELVNEFPKRCLKCYKLRLENTAQYAKDNGYDLFSTTLLVSPYQNHNALLEIGKNIEREIGIEFYYNDWRTHYTAGQKSAKSINIYRQKYCGCEPSSEYR